MTDALTISGLKKTYPDFVLDSISFSVPSGSIVGLIGENGAGKSTTISAALGLVQKESGSVSVLGKEELDNELREQIGVVFDGNNFPENLSPRKISHVMRDIYRSWNDQTFLELLKKFSVPADKSVKQFSKGMKMKLAIAVALSHNSKLLILDEATSGLDPVVRDDILDLLLDFVQDEDHSILLSSHITSDLEKSLITSCSCMRARSYFPSPRMNWSNSTESSNAERHNLMRWTNRILLYTGKWIMNGRHWLPTGTKCRKSIRTHWSFPLPLMKSCFFT